MRSARRLLAAGAFTLLGMVALAAVPAPAWADGADQITITSDELPEPMVWRATDSPRLVAALHSEVSWLIGRKATTEEPEPETLGPRYVLDAHIEGEARHRFHLYPLAEGGPRVFRPEEQPGDRQTNPAWYFGRLSMPDTLYAAGIEIPGAQPRVPGGGGGGGEPAPSDEVPPSGQGSGVLETWREGMQLVALTAAAIAAGLAAVALLIRRRV
jgi:hypothetical protein